jgi:hypothetical protein
MLMLVMQLFEVLLIEFAMPQIPCPAGVVPSKEFLFLFRIFEYP